MIRYAGEVAGDPQKKEERMKTEAAYRIICNVIISRRIRRAHLAATTGLKIQSVHPGYVKRIAAVLGRTE